MKLKKIMIMTMIIIMIMIIITLMKEKIQIIFPMKKKIII
jgi:hypothetical protein